MHPPAVPVAVRSPDRSYPRLCTAASASRRTGDGRGVRSRRSRSRIVGVHPVGRVLRRSVLELRGISRCRIAYAVRSASSWRSVSPSRVLRHRIPSQPLQSELRVRVACGTSSVNAARSANQPSCSQPSAVTVSVRYGVRRGEGFESVEVVDLAAAAPRASRRQRTAGVAPSTITSA